MLHFMIRRQGNTSLAAQAWIRVPQGPGLNTLPGSHAGIQELHQQHANLHAGNCVSERPTFFGLFQLSNQRAASLGRRSSRSRLQRPVGLQSERRGVGGRRPLLGAARDRYPTACTAYAQATLSQSSLLTCMLNMIGFFARCCASPSVLKRPIRSMPLSAQWANIA